MITTGSRMDQNMNIHRKCRIDQKVHNQDQKVHIYII